MAAYYVMQVSLQDEVRAMQLLLEEADLTLAQLEALVLRFNGEPFSRCFQVQLAGASGLVNGSRTVGFQSRQWPSSQWLVHWGSVQLPTTASRQHVYVSVLQPEAVHLEHQTCLIHPLRCPRHRGCRACV